MFRLDLRALAILRILTAVIVIYDVWDRLQVFDIFYGEFGVLRGDGAIGRFPHFSLLNLSPAYYFRATFFALTILSALGLLLGYRTRLMTILTWFLVLNLQHLEGLTVFSGDDVLRLLLFWSIFLPTGARYSIDARSAPSSVINEIAAAALIAQITILFWSAGVLKSLDPGWRAGQGVKSALLGYANVFGEFWIQFPFLLTVLSFAVIAVQILGPVLFFGGSRGRIVGLVSLIVFQLSLALTLNLSFFPWITIAGLLALWPPPVQGPFRSRSLLAFIMFALVLCLPSLSPGKYAPEKGGPLKMVGLDQEWSMFTPVPDRIYWLSLIVRLENGRIVDLSTMKDFDDERDSLRGEIPARIRWGALIHQSSRDHSIMKNLAEAICIQGRSLSPENRVRWVRIAVFSALNEDVRQAHGPLDSNVLFKSDCRKEAVGRD